LDDGSGGIVVRIINVTVTSSLQRLRKHEQGQGLVEYALILALIAVATVAATFLLGQAVLRIYGMVGAAAGAKYNSVGERAIEIQVAQCIVKQGANITGLWVTGFTNENVANLTASTDQTAGVSGLASVVESMPPNGFRFDPIMAYSADESACPKSVVIQAADGAIAISPVTPVLQP
jgi:Flp pilus assembly pilin Flp